MATNESGSASYTPVTTQMASDGTATIIDGPSIQIQQLNRDELIAALEALGLDTTGTVDELRKRLRKYRRENKLSPNPVTTAPSFPPSGHNYTETPSVNITTISSQPPFATAPITANPPKLGLTIPSTVHTVYSSSIYRSASTSNLYPASTYVTSIPTYNNFSIPTYTTSVPLYGQVVTPTTTFQPPLQPSMLPNQSLSKIHKWKIQFNGKSDPIAFLEQLEELRQLYCISANDLLPGCDEVTLFVIENN